MAGFKYAQMREEKSHKHADKKKTDLPKLLLSGSSFAQLKKKGED